jgi:hypothetical protein
LGDRKTIENSTAFVNKLSNRSLSFKELSMQAQIFLNAFFTRGLAHGNEHAAVNLQDILGRYPEAIQGPFEMETHIE